MLGSLIVVLPNAFTGGELIVRAPTGSGNMASEAVEETLYDFTDKSASTMQYVAFYGDCCHEVKPVESGMRVCLAYNIVPDKSLSEVGSFDSSFEISKDAVALARDYLVQLVENRSKKTLIYHLSHHYSTQSMNLNYLKGADKRAAAVLSELIIECNRELSTKSKLVMTFDSLEIKYNLDPYNETEVYWESKTDDFAIISKLPEYRDDAWEMDTLDGLYPNTAFKVSHEQYDAGNQGGGAEEIYRQAILCVDVNLPDSAAQILRDAEEADEPIVNSDAIGSGANLSAKILTLTVAEGFVAGTVLFFGMYTTIEDDAAQFLANCGKNKLIINDLQSLTDASAAALSEYPGDLRLLGLKDISDTAAQHLAKHSKLTITLDNLPASAAKILRDAGHG